MAKAKSSRPTFASDFIRSDHDKAVYLDNVHTDNLMSAFLGLGAEHWALRRRMMVIEAMLAKSSAIDPAAVEAYDPTPEQQKAWEAARDDFIERVFGVLVRDTAEIPMTMPGGTVPPRPVTGQKLAPGYGM